MHPTGRAYGPAAGPGRSSDGSARGEWLQRRRRHSQLQVCVVSCGDVTVLWCHQDLPTGYARSGQLPDLFP
jgi:hypothetical protein